ncbi:putative membrane associated DnaJ chaperone [Aspergillus ochraceoroseus]|uniref:Putative membrane associated DnaJ chaperone n=1 Tax=Aspergillus ochraceoroseus TaxID=138278 RepID=A0A0F8U7K2_9EURO|nr:putative membrane associated DnaJ chaperone [Aspergillus ochraceoroseus]
MSSLLSFVGWAVLPNYATSFLQNVYYGITIRAGDPKPQPGSPRYARHRRRIFIAVVTAYLLYTLFEAFHRVQAQGDFYQVLGVSPLADERFIKSRFRRLAAQHHPDKVGSGDGVSDDYFVFLKMAQETLVDPASASHTTGSDPACLTGARRRQRMPFWWPDSRSQSQDMWEGS